MNFKTTLSSILTILMVGGVFLSFNTRNDISEFNLDATATDHRLYVVIKNSWFNNTNMYIWHDGTGGAAFDNAPAMTRILDDYYEDLYFFDVPVSATKFIVKRIPGAISTGNFWQQTVDITIRYATPTVYFVKDNTGDNTKSQFDYWNTAPMNSGQLAAVLSWIDTCSASYSSGFNAWPQLNTLFVSPSAYTGSTPVNDHLNYPSDPQRESTTITNKVNRLTENYTRGSAT
jgi:hypothetical protein